jgi:CRISPR-associated protein Csx14
MNPEPSIRINVDVTNPGQFFACCGLLELADRLWPGAEGWFEEGRFCVACGGTLLQALSALIASPAEEILKIACNGLEVRPLIAPLSIKVSDAPLCHLILDAWTTIRSQKGAVAVVANPPWNFWSGQQTSLSIWTGLRTTFEAQLKNPQRDENEGLLSQRVFQKGRFGFDPGPAWNALDVGFSPNEHTLEVESSAAVELLAAVGIQRFRPVVSDDRESFDYATWSHPLMPSVASAAVSGGLPSHLSERFRGYVVSRGQYAALTYAHRLRKDKNHE